jgi:hypothetical protein
MQSGFHGCRIIPLFSSHPFWIDHGIGPLNYGPVALFPGEVFSVVVLPKPAGAEMRVSLRCRPSFNRSIKRGRGTMPGRGGGIYSLVAKIGAGTS